MRIVPLLFAIGSLIADEEALFLRRIAEFWEEGEYQIAKGQMEEFIGEYPESPYADALCSALGDLFLREKKFSEALNYYSRVQSAEFRDKVLLNRLQCLYEMQWYATLADECEKEIANKENMHVTYFLAISLYHQCLNATKEPETLIKLATRAKPYFETLLASPLADDISQGYAHLCCVLKDYPKAASLYMNLAEKDLAAKEEMLFQAALIQSEFDKELAIKTFERIATLGQSRAQDAAYNRLVLAFEIGKFDSLADEDLVFQVAKEKRGAVHLLLGRNFLKAKKFDAAIEELKSAVNATEAETLRSALLCLMDAAYQSNQLEPLDFAIEAMKENDPTDPELPKAYFSRAQILKKTHDDESAKKELGALLAHYPKSGQKAQILFELTHLDYKVKDWTACYERAKNFLSEFQTHELAPFAKRYQISALVELANEKQEWKKQLIQDLEISLNEPGADREEWNFLLAKTHYSLSEFEKAIQILEPFQTPNASLLKALCQKELGMDLTLFCKTVEEASSKGATLLDAAQIHIALFNAYLELNQMDGASDHLFAAIENKGEVKKENLLWLVDTYLEKLQEEPRSLHLAHRLVLVLTQCKAALHDPEWTSCKLAKVYAILGKTDEAIALLDRLTAPNAEARLVLGECYARKGIVQKATALFDSIISSHMRSTIAASASLQGARLKLASENPDLSQIATQLKTLVVQRNLEGEPIYLEAALDYVDVQAKTDWNKRIALLNKTKSDFERKDDLLSKDYHAARTKWPQKDRIYCGYLQLIDASILSAQANMQQHNQQELYGKAKEILIKIINEQTATSLLERAQVLLKNIDEPKK